jgi:hypothetical protein
MLKKKRSVFAQIPADQKFDKRFSRLGKLIGINFSTTIKIVTNWLLAKLV